MDKPTHPLRSSRVIVPWKGFFFACLICQPSTTQPPTKEEVPQAVLEGPFIARNHQLFWSLPAPTPQSLVPLAVGGRDDLLECESTFLLDLCGWGRGKGEAAEIFPRDQVNHFPPPPPPVPLPLRVMNQIPVSGLSTGELNLGHMARGTS